MGRTMGWAILAVAAAGLTACSDGDPKRSVAPTGQSDTATSAPPTSSATTRPVSKAVITVPRTVTPANPTTPVAVSIANGTLTSVRLTNAAGRAVAGTLAGDGTSWRSTEVLGYAKSYRLTATGADPAGLTVTRTATVRTLTPGNLTMPSITDIYGNAVRASGTYGVGMVVRVHFDEQVDKAAAEKTLAVRTTPSVTGGWYWRDAQNVFWRPQSYYPSGTTVQVTAKVYGKQVGSGLYGESDRSVSFGIGAKHVSIADAQRHDVRVYTDGALVRTMPTSMGKGGYEPGNRSIHYWTMPGTYTVINHEDPAIMSSASFGVEKGSPNYYTDVTVPYSTKISTDGIYLHEKNSTAAQQGRSNVSHGCLNLVTKHAKWFFEYSVVGDVVQVVNSGGPRINFDQGGQWSVPWSEWQQGSALA